MKLLYCGDIVGRRGREIVLKEIPSLIREWKLDWVIANVENSAAGFGLTSKICEELLDAGVDALTTGNHVWDQPEALTYITKQPRLLRPLNYPEGTPGKGVCVLSKPSCKGNLVILQVMGRLFMDTLDDPFAGIEKALQPYRLSDPSIGGIFVDIHAEATSEKMAMGHMLDGRVSAVVGTHTHIPTADCQIFPGGTAYMSDVGMCGDYDSVIGMEKEIPIKKFRTKMPTPRMSPALGEPTLCAVFVDIDEATGLARRIEPVRIGGRLQPTKLLQL